jgi:hypothetical protein
MPHPYLTRRAQIFGFFAILLLIGTALAVALGFTVIAISAAAAAAVLLALAISSQIRFGPRISEVPKAAPWPPSSFRGWFGVFMFVVAIIAMILIMVLRVLHGYKI